MSEGTAAKTVRDIVMVRLEERLKDRDFRKRYETWIRSETTRESLEMLRDVLCRPVPVDSSIDGNVACYALGLSEGAWLFFDCINNLRSLNVEVADLAPDYGVSDKQQNKKGA